ncbi:MAG: hypothetical protein ACM3YE_17575 [Bacteroidota bacterium]
MSHRHSEEPKTELKQVISSSDEPKENNPFLSKNDIALLTMATPFLSPNAQKLISFFVNFTQGSFPLPDFGGVQNQLGNSDPNKMLQDLLPALLGLVGRMNQNGIDPSLFTSLLGMFNNNTQSSPTAD